ncbi:hypothetical protein Aab01nite_43150 [Paractinoplanes abujensis]|uniref:Uncharacterized protein n=1 Tax=Paractinoplanes abujensis TaxID=882441 RepID=A0A7W7G3C1_9ACTN|nr:hypothetical protein [Actinoplanes abujensis]MBB4694060.1 hypothetical protein [Actinoplanes abujensis]GID20725.1 hypothetical protein Aab01nite_43150 [Actinoplanes abujensis]
MSGVGAAEAVRGGPDDDGPRRAAATRGVLTRVWARREWILVVVGGLALAVLLTWPTMKDPRHTVPGDIGDPALFAYQIAWGGHALLTDPAHLWDANTFYPEPHSLAFTDTVLGYMPFGMIGSGLDDAVLRYNILYVLLHALAFAGAYALTRQLGAHPLGAAVAGVAWAFAPWRLAHAGHMNVISTGGIALCLAMLARGHGWSLRRGHRPDRHKPGWALAGWLVGAWQISLGLAIGLAFAYVMIAVCLVAAALYGWAWWRRGRPVFGRRLLAADLIGGLIFGGATAYMGLAYLRVVDLNPQADRGLNWTEMYSAPWRGLFIAPDSSWLWGDRHAAVRADLFWPPEMALLPGVALIALAAAGVFFSVFRVRHRVLLLVGVAVAVLLALGANTPWHGDPGYLTLSKHLPGWNALRTSGRMMLWISLLMAVLAAGAISALALRARDAAPWGAGPLKRSKFFAARLALLIPLALVVVEGVNKTPHPELIRYPAAMAAAQEPILVLPSGGSLEMSIMLWTANDFPRIPNGIVTFEPASQQRIREVSKTFPDAPSIAALRAEGIRSVVVLPEWLPDTPWVGVPDRATDGLGITREVIDGHILYRLD